VFTSRPFQYLAQRTLQPGTSTTPGISGLDLDIPLYVHLPSPASLFSENSSSELIRALYTFLRLGENGEYSLSLQQSASAWLADPPDRVSSNRANHHSTLDIGCATLAAPSVSPSSHVPDGLKKLGNIPIAYGEFVGVWEGSYLGGGTENLVQRGCNE